MNNLEDLLPHRKPMLLIDEAWINPDGTAAGTSKIKGNEWFLQGHFPDNPVVPGVILCEMMAQTCCVLIAEKAKGATPYFTALDGVRFKKPVRPGDKVTFSCKIIQQKGPFYFAKGEGKTGGDVCVIGEFSFAVI